MEREKAIKVVKEMLEKNVEGLSMSDEKMDKTLVDLGVDSLDVMIVMLDISEATGIAIDDDQAEVLNTPERIVDFLTA
jgi:acyl carrier protein